MSERVEEESIYATSTALAALVRIAQHHGLSFTADELIRAFPFQGPEATPALLLRIATRIGMQGRSVRINRGELGTLAQSVPAILVLEDGRAVLLDRVHQRDGADLALIEDPGSDSGISALIDEARLFDIW